MEYSRNEYRVASECNITLELYRKLKPSSCMIFYELKKWNVEAYAFKRPSHGPILVLRVLNHMIFLYI